MITTTTTRSPHSAPQRTGDEAETPRATRVLLVEDEPLTAEVFARSLERSGIRVDVARDGLQALRHLRDHSPSLLVLDMNLPAMSGASVVRELRRSGRRDLPVVVVSGSDPRDSSLGDAELHPGVWIQKPVKPRRLVEIVRGLLGNAGA